MPDPQASLSTLLGVRPDESGPTIYDAVRYGEGQRPMREVIRKTYFTGLDLASANLELEEFEFYAPLMSSRSAASRAALPSSPVSPSRSRASRRITTWW